jgi:hypothetical protein
MSQRSNVVAAIVAVTCWAALSAGPASAHGHDEGPLKVAIPTLTGPVQTQQHLDGTHGIPYTSSAVDLRTHGDIEQEYFVSGTAQAYSPVGALGSDGKWTVAPSSTAPYKTRIVVRRPIDMRRFNGTVVVEWMNATTGRDLDVGWVFGHNELLRDGYVYVGVTAQALPVTSSTGLQSWDPERYASLSHPGDQYSYDIFSQVGQALATSKSGVLRGSRPERVIAYGDSQSAFRLVTYLNAIQPRDQVYDGFLVHSRFGNGAALNTGATPTTPTFIRSDLDAKVITLETETDILRASNGFLASRQPDSNSFRLWEAAGTSHFEADQEVTMRLQAFRQSPFAAPPLQFNTCPESMNTVHQNDLVDTAFHDLNDWISHGGHGNAPPAFPRIQVVGSGATASYAKDPLGNSLGGVRLPQLQTPIGVQSGLGNTGTGTCTLAGSFRPFDAATLRRLYPTHDDYVRKFQAAVWNAGRAGVIQPYDAEVLAQEAEDSSVPASAYVP